MFAADPAIRSASTREFESEIEKLRSRFKNGLPENEQHEIQNVSFGDLLGAITKIQEKQRETRSYRNLKRIEPFVTGMTEFGKVIAVFANAVPIVAFLWTASNYADAFDLLLDAYKDIGNSLPQFGTYAQLFGDKPSVRKVLVEVYDGILVFHKRAMEFFRRPAWKQLLRASWDGFRGPFGEILTEFRKHQALLEKEGHLANFENVNFMIKDLEKRDEEDRRRQLVDIYRWLSAADYGSDHSHFLSLRNAFPGTSMWLLQRNDMISWLDSGSEISVFWLHGILGSGKTIAASCVCEALIHKTGGMSSHSVAYFYCKEGDASRDTCDGIFRAILAQLLEQNSDVVPYFNSQLLSSTHDPLKRAGLKALVKKLFEVLNLIYLVIDGLDEIDRSERAEFFDIILPFLKSQRNGDGGRKIKIFISSRREDDIETNIYSIGSARRKSYEITKVDNRSDIGLYVSCKVQKLQKKFRLDHSRREEISKDVCSRAGVMFLLAKLILDNLMKQTNLEELEEELKPKVLPSKLRDAYGRIFRHRNKYLGDKEQAKSREIFGLIGFSKRSLKTSDIQGALSVNTSNQTLNYKARCLMPDATSAIRELCSVIVEVRSDQSVGFIHTTARQFVRELYTGEPACQSSRLTDLCLTYLAFDCLKFDRGEVNVQKSILNGDYAFLEYAANNWLHHLRDLDSDRDHLGPERFSDLRHKTKAVLDLHQPNMAQDYIPAADMTRYFLAFSDCPEIFLHPTLRNEAHLKMKSCDDSTEDSDSTNPNPQPFLVASQLLRTRLALERVVNSSHEVEDIAFLRECYGPISFKCDVIGCPRYAVGFETLQERDGHMRSHNRPSKCQEHGCFYGEVGFASERILNQHISLCHTAPASNRFIFPTLTKSPPPAVDERKRFREAIKNENLDLLREMIHTNGSLKGQLSSGSFTGLEYAARFGKLNSVQCLLDCGCNIGAVSDHGTALHAACRAGKTDVVQFLLSNSSAEDVNGKDSEGRTPLSFMATVVGKKAEPLLKILLEHDGVEVNAKDNNGRTPLSWAAARGRLKSGSEPVVKMFLEQAKVDVDAKDDEGRTPLSWAAGEGVAGVVELFLEHGVRVDVNAKDDRGRTPLSWAAAREHGVKPLVKMLLGQGRVDADAKDHEGRTPLSWAVTIGRVGVVKMLLEHGGGVDVNAKDNKGRTPLSWAAARGGWESESELVIGVLLEQPRIDVDSKDDEDRTPLSWAASSGFVGVVKALLGHSLGITVNSKDKGDRTPLSWATAREDKKKEQVVKVLVQHGAVAGVP